MKKEGSILRTFSRIIWNKQERKLNDIYEVVNCYLISMKNILTLQ
jgi:hypothetical protein